MSNLSSHLEGEGRACEREFLFAAKRLWSEAILSRKFPSSFRALKRPYVERNPLARVLSFLLAKEARLPSPPFVLAPHAMPLHEACQYALLLPLVQEEEAGYRLASSLLPLLPFPALWSKEEEFSERETQLSILLLRRAFGSQEPLPASSDPFFRALATHLPAWKEGSFSEERTLFLHRSEEFSAVITVEGEGTSLGALRTGDVECFAFGPQAFPLSDSQGFGILRPSEELPVEPWASCFCDPEVWFEVGHRLEGKSLHLALRFYGLKVEKPLAFALYMRAPFCEIGEEKILPRTLRRYRGEARSVLFGGKLRVESALPTKTEVIPLAGDRGFWNADLLLAFEVNPFEARGEYAITLEGVSSSC